MLAGECMPTGVLAHHHHVNRHHDVMVTVGVVVMVVHGQYPTSGSTNSTCTHDQQHEQHTAAATASQQQALAGAHTCICGRARTHMGRSVGVRRAGGADGGRWREGKTGTEYARDTGASGAHETRSVSDRRAATWLATTSCARCTHPSRPASPSSSWVEVDRSCAMGRDTGQRDTHSSQCLANSVRAQMRALAAYLGSCVPGVPRTGFAWLRTSSRSAPGLC